LGVIIEINCAYCALLSQVLLELNELFPAVSAAEQAVTLDPTWAVAWQTLGRAQSGLGEIEMVGGWHSISSCCKKIYWHCYEGNFSSFYKVL